MPILHLDLHVPKSEDGKGTFAEVADILDHLTTIYAWHPYVHMFLTAATKGARELDQELGPEEG